MRLPFDAFTSEFSGFSIGLQNAPAGRGVDCRALILWAHYPCDGATDEGTPERAWLTRTGRSDRLRDGATPSFTRDAGPIWRRRIVATAAATAAILPPIGACWRDIGA